MKTCRKILSVLGLTSLLAGTTAIIPRRVFAAGPAGPLPARAVAGRIILAARMLEIADLRRLMDEGDRELDVLREEYKDALAHRTALWGEPYVAPHPGMTEFIHKANPIFERITRLEGLLEALERLPVDDLTQGIALKADPQFLVPPGLARHLETRQFSADELATFSVVGVSA